jgi:hypothetical protein
MDDLLPNDGPDQGLSVRGIVGKPTAKRGAGRSPVLESTEGNAQRKNLRCGIGGPLRQSSRAAGMTAGFSSRNMPIGNVISAGTFVMITAIL